MLKKKFLIVARFNFLWRFLEKLKVESKDGKPRNQFPFHSKSIWKSWLRSQTKMTLKDAFLPSRTIFTDTHNLTHTHTHSQTHAHTPKVFQVSDNMFKL